MKGRPRRTARRGGLTGGTDCVCVAVKLRRGFERNTFSLSGSCFNHISQALCVCRASLRTIH